MNVLLKIYEDWILMIIGQFCGTEVFYILRVMWMFVCFVWHKWNNGLVALKVLEFCDRCFFVHSMLVRLWGSERHPNGNSEKYSLDWTHGKWQKRHPMVLIIHRMHTTCYTFLKIYFKYTPLSGSYFEMLLIPTCVLKYFMQNAVYYSILNPLLKASVCKISFLISICPLGFRKLTIAFMNDQNCKWL